MKQTHYESSTVRTIEWLYLEAQTEVLSAYSKICFYLGRERKFSFGEGHKVKAGFLFSCKHSVIRPCISEEQVFNGVTFNPGC